MKEDVILLFHYKSSLKHNGVLQGSNATFLFSSIFHGELTKTHITVTAEWLHLDSCGVVIVDLWLNKYIFYEKELSVLSRYGKQMVQIRSSYSYSYLRSIFLELWTLSKGVFNCVIR